MAKPATRSATVAVPASPGILRLVESFREGLDELAGMIVAGMADEIPAYAQASPAMREGATEHVRAHLEALVSSLEEGRAMSPEDLHFIRPFATKRANDGVPLADFMHAFRVGQREIWRTLYASITDEETKEAALSIVAPIIHYINVASFQAAEVYNEVLQLLHARGERVRRDLLADLMEGRLPEPGPRLDAAREVGLEPGVGVVVISAQPRRTPGDEHSLRSAATALARACGGATAPLAVVRRDEIVLVVPLSGDRTATSVGDAMAPVRDRLADQGVLLAIGVSTAQAGVERVLHGYREAHDASERLDADGGVLALPSLSAFDYLSLIGDATASRLIAEPIREFVAEDSADGGVLSQTLLAYVESDLNATAAAERLFVHTNTARYRLNKIAERTGCDLRKIDDLLELLLAIKLAGGGAQPVP